MWKNGERERGLAEWEAHHILCKEFSWQRRKCVQGTNGVHYNFRQSAKENSERGDKDTKKKMSPSDHNSKKKKKSSEKG
jgi:hypothetical protein